MKSSENAPETKTIWDDSQAQYQRDGFNLYWELLDRIQQYQTKCMTGDEALDYMSYTMSYVKEVLPGIQWVTG